MDRVNYWCCRCIVHFNFRILVNFQSNTSTRRTISWTFLSTTNLILNLLCCIQTNAVPSWFCFDRKTDEQIFFDTFRFPIYRIWRERISTKYTLFIVDVYEDGSSTKDGADTGHLPEEVTDRQRIDNDEL